MSPPTDHLVAAPRTRIYVAPSALHGRGVFAAEPFAAGDVVEECPVIRFPAAQREHIDATLIDEYYFDWDGDGAIALGLGSLYNHSDTPVAEYLKDRVNDVLIVRAISAIAAGEEITFSYSGPARPELVAPEPCAASAVSSELE